MFFVILLAVVTVTGMAQDSVATNKVAKANKNSPPPVFIASSQVAKPVQVFDYSQTPIVANRRPVTQQLSGQAVQQEATYVQGVQDAPSMPTQAPVMQAVAYYPVQQSYYPVYQSAPVQALTVPSHTYQQPTMYGYGGFNQPVYTVTTGPDGFAWSSFGLGAFVGASIQSYPVTHRVRVYESSVNATYSFGGRSGGGGQYHGGGHRR